MAGFASFALLMISIFNEPTTMKSPLLHLPLLLLYEFTKLLGPVAACVDLTPFLTDSTAGNMEQVAGGGNVSDNVPLYFDIGRQQIENETPLTFCLNGLKIPTMVGENTCDEGQSCWLAVGYKANDVNGDGLNLDYCESEERGIAPCYECLCGGLDWNDGGSTNDEIIIGYVCGLSWPDKWGVSCTDTENSRGNPEDNPFASIYITVCPANFSEISGCTYCSGGTLPAFQVAVQWLPKNCVTNGWPSSSEHSSLFGAFVLSTSLLFLLL